MPGCYHPREPQLRQMPRRSGWRLANHIGQRASRPAVRRRQRLLCAADLELPLFRALLWAETPEGQPFSPDMLRAAQQWVNLGLIRGIGDLVLFLLLLFALLVMARDIRLPDEAKLQIGAAERTGEIRVGSSGR